MINRGMWQNDKIDMWQIYKKIHVAKWHETFGKMIKETCGKMIKETCYENNIPAFSDKD